MGVAELLDPEAVRQLKTTMTPAGLHTYPVENSAAVLLDPTLTRNALNADLFNTLPLGASFSLHEAIDWLVHIAEDAAARAVGGLHRLRAAHRAMYALLDGATLSERAVDDVAYVCALAIHEAHFFGSAGRVLIREVVRVIAEHMRGEQATVIDVDAADVIDVDVDDAESGVDLRNLSLQIGGLKLSPNWGFLERLGRVGLNIGKGVGLAALQTKLAGIGLTPTVMSVLEHEFNREGATLGPLAPQVPSLASLALLPLLSGSSSSSSSPKNVNSGKAAQMMAASGPLPAPAVAREIRNALIATPGMILAEMSITNTDIMAIGRDIRASFTTPFEQQLAAAEARFERELGRIPGAGIPSKGPGDPGIGLGPKKGADGKHPRVTLVAGVNDFISTDKDYAKVYGWMTPAPKPADIQWKSYQGNFVHSWGEFEREWQAWFAANRGLGSRMWGGTRDTALDFRERAKKWRDQFLALGGVSNSPAPQMPTQSSLFDGLSKNAKTAALVVGGLVAASIVIPPFCAEASPRNQPRTPTSPPPTAGSYDPASRRGARRARRHRFALRFRRSPTA